MAALLYEAFVQPFKGLKPILGKVSDFLWPPLCLACENRVLTAQGFCAACWKDFPSISAPYCDCCGLPFDIPLEGAHLCGACMAQPPVFDQARAALLYKEQSKPLILRLKHADWLHPVPALARFMAAAGADFWQEPDVVLMPVPLHRLRLLKRRYNQAALLARALAALTGKTLLVDGLKRIRATPPQGHFSRGARKGSVQGAFAMKKGVSVKGKTIVLVDDVMTSGATASACSAVLKKAGARKVLVLTMARVPAHG
ncbi:MAG: ComF family protein [Alphaproteobacteria bacterium]|nr:ComF family protein [Alphaproteobacteria bacterium]